MTTRRNLKKYADGGGLDIMSLLGGMGKGGGGGAAAAGGGASGMSLVGPAAAIGSQVLNTLDQGDDLGFQSSGTLVATGALKGASMGAAAGPIGAGIGAVVGGGVGLLTYKSQSRQEKRMRKKINNDSQNRDNEFSNSAIENNPELFNGTLTNSYFRTGGTIGEDKLKTTTTRSPQMNPAMYKPFGTSADQAFKEGWYPVQTGLQGSVTYRNNYGPFNGITHPGDSGKGHYRLTGNSNGSFDVGIYDDAGTQLQLMGKGMSYEQANKTYFTGAQGNVKSRADQMQDDKSIAHYRTGGSVRQMPGGTATQLSGDAVEMKGATHEEGGIDLPGTNANVEDGETMAGNFVFSKELGFAQIHKPLAKKIGKLEDLPQTKERANTLRRYKAREQDLALAQEYFKRQNGIQ